MKPVRWSALVLAELAAAASSGACASTAEPPHTPPPSAPSATPAVAVAPTPSQVPLSDPPGTPKGATPFVELAKAERNDLPLSPEHVREQAFGRGLLAFYSAENADRGVSAPCPFAPGASDCRFFRVAPLAKPVSLVEAHAPFTAKQLGAWGKVTPAPHDWSAFGAGRDRAYAVRRDQQLAIDTIDERGAVGSFVASTGSVAVHDVHVVESSGAVFVAAENESEELVVASVKTDAAGKAQGAMSAFVTLPIKGAPPWATARWVRGQVDSKKRVAWGDWAAAPLGAGLAIAFVDVTPPAKGTPRAGIKEPKGAKHGCGRPSRPLSDASVEKTVRLVALDARGVVGREIVVSNLGGVAKAPRLDLAPRADGGVSLLGKGFSKELAELGEVPSVAVADPPPPAFASAPLQTFDALGYDPASGEGMMIAREGDVLVARTFDALGRPTGEPRRFPAADEAPSPHVPSLTRVGGAWLYLEEDADTVLFVTGPHAGKRVEVPELSRVGANHTLGIFPWAEGRAVVVRASNRHEVEPRETAPGRKVRRSYEPRPSGLLLSVIDVGKGAVERPLSPADGWPRRDGDVPKMTSALSAAAGPRGLVIAGLASSPSGDTRPMVLTAKPGGTSWEELELPAFAGVHAVDAVPLEHDVVVVLSSGRERRALWTTSGEVRAIPLGPGASPKHSAKGSLLPDGALPAAPGELVPLPDGDALGSCPTAVVTGASRVVLGCLGHVDSDAASLRAGLRTLRF